MISLVNIKAILFGTAIYGGLYLLLLILTTLTGEFFQGYWGQFALSPYMTLMYPIAGYAAGIKSINHGLLHGALVGVCIALITAAISITFIGEEWFGESIIGGTLNYLLSCAIMCGLGGGIGELHSIKKFTA